MMVGFLYPSLGRRLIDLLTIAPAPNLCSLLKILCDRPKKPEATIRGFIRSIPAIFTGIAPSKTF
jgi:hypothetical protein